MALLSTIDRVASHTPTQFVAPILDAAVIEVFVLQDSIPYRFRVVGLQPGWYLLTPRTELHAVSERMAYPYEYFQYLGKLPRFYVIALHRLSPRTWLCVPYNVSDAEQRGWGSGEPKPLHLVRESISPLTYVCARSLAGTLLYDCTVELETTANLKNARDIVAQWQRQARIEAAKKLEEERKKTTEGYFSYRLSLAGAQMKNWSEFGEGFRVTWVHDGVNRETVVERSGRVRSAGICLSGRDGDYDLSSIVAVMEEGDD